METLLFFAANLFFRPYRLRDFFIIFVQKEEILPKCIDLSCTCQLKNGNAERSHSMYTYHSVIRTSKTAGLNKNAAVRMIENARVKGKRSCEFGSNERKYLQRKESKGNKPVIYAGYCFVFNAQDVCITMYNVPSWFGKAQYQAKRQIRDPRKYYRRYAEHIEDFAV